MMADLGNTGSFVRVGDGSRSLSMWCPGCDQAHRITYGGSNNWSWDGNEDSPTVSPSILVTGVQWDESSPFHRPTHRVEVGAQTTCHSFLRAGVWEFLGDCTHHLAGQKVPMVPWPMTRRREDGR